MVLDNLTEDEIKSILTKLLVKVEGHKEEVEKYLRTSKVYRYQGAYCINFYNGYESKVCAIDARKAYVSSESINDNIALTEYYHEILNNVLRKHDEQLVTC